MEAPRGPGRAAAVLCAALLGIAGCRTAPPPVVGPGAGAPWAEQLDALERLQRYGLNGRVAVAANGEGFSASLRYAQQGRGAQLSLDGPLGIGGVRVEFDDREFEIETSRGERLEGPEARALLERRLGFALPLAELRWWLLGIPAPGEVTVDRQDSGEIRGFMQNGWRVSIESRAAGLGFALPRRLTAERVGAGIATDDTHAPDAAPQSARMKLLIDRWTP
jgi:outer membrane lipoprotein LolB